MFILICCIFANLLCQQCPKCLVNRLSMPIPLRIIGCRIHTFQQKMICQILDGIINEMNSLINDYNQRTSKLGYYALIQKLCCDYCSISFQCSCFHPLGSIVYVSQPQLWACDQGKGVARVRAKRKPGSHIRDSRECRRV